MKGSEFITMQLQDIETRKDKAVLSQVVEAMRALISPLDDVPHDKTAEDCYNKMREHASENRNGSSYCFGPDETKAFIAKYLGLKPAADAKSGVVSLEDFL